MIRQKYDHAKKIAHQIQKILSRISYECKFSAKRRLSNMKFFIFRFAFRQARIILNIFLCKTLTL